MNPMHALATLCGALAAAAAVHGQVVLVNSPIPDNDANGLVSTLDVTTSVTTIQNIEVTLNISSAPGNAAWNGDLYAYLSHGPDPSPGFAVLLNRVGVSGANSSGYGDPGFAVSLSDSAAKDIHLYQTSSPTYDANGRLTSLWQPDGRNILPSSSAGTFDSASRSAKLASFTGLDPNGQWVLFISDCSVGNEAVLDSWTLSINPVPEPQSYAVITAVALLLLAIARERFRLAS
jgi:hypothetical protein